MTDDYNPQAMPVAPGTDAVVWRLYDTKPAPADADWPRDESGV